MSNTNQMQITQVYAVIGGYDYEGENFDSLKLFDCKSSAQAYYQHLKEQCGYDYALMNTREVNMESAIVTQ